MKKIQLNYTAYSDLFRSLSLLMHSGVALSDGLLIIADEESDHAYASLLRDMSEHLDTGLSFASALESSSAFPAYAVGLIEVAERVGRLEEVLMSLSRYYEDRERIKKSIKNALTYPTVMLLMMFVVIVVLLVRVLPVFDEVYGSLGGSLTGIAGSLLALGGALSAALPYIGIILGVSVIVGALIAMIPGAGERCRNAAVAVFGDRGVSKSINNAHFAQALSMAVSSGMQVEEGIELAEKLLTDSPRALARCKKCREMVFEGKDLAEALGECGFLSRSACRMLTLGMRSGSADTVMSEIADRMSDEAEEALESKTAQIEPALVLVTSFLVGAILLSVMLPLINIMKAIG